VWHRDIDIPYPVHTQENYPYQLLVAGNAVKVVVAPIVPIVLVASGIAVAPIVLVVPVASGIAVAA